MLLDAGYLPVPLYHPDDAPVRINLLTGWGAGDFEVVNYDGHGTKSSLGSENFLTTGDVAHLDNNYQVPIFAALTCAAGNSAYPGILSLADSLVLDPEGGSIAAFAPSGLSLDTFAHKMNVELIRVLLVEGESLGAAHVSSHKPTLEGVAIPDFMREIYLNLGDPAIHSPK